MSNVFNMNGKSLGEITQRAKQRLRKYPISAHLKGLLLARKFTRHGIIVVSGGYPFPKVSNYGGTIEVANCAFFEGVRIEVYKNARLSIGNGSYVNRNSLIIAVGSVTIGTNCRIAWDVVVMDSDLHPVDAENMPTEFSPVVIEDDAWIGCRSIILKGVKIGRGAVIAAGSVVTKDIPPGVIAGGSPAKVLSENPSHADYFFRKNQSSGG